MFSVKFFAKLTFTTRSSGTFALEVVALACHIDLHEQLLGVLTKVARREMREGLENASLNPSQVFEGLTSLDSVPKSKMTDAAALDPAERIFRRRRHLLYVEKRCVIPCTPFIHPL